MGRINSGIVDGGIEECDQLRGLVKYGKLWHQIGVQCVQPPDE